MSKSPALIVKDEDLNFPTVETYLRWVTTPSIFSDTMRANFANSSTIARMPDADREKTKEIMAHEQALGQYATEQWLKRKRAAEAPRKNDAQKAVLKQYGLFSETKMATVLTLTLNLLFNDSAERAALKTDLSDIALARGYDISAGRQFLRRQGIANFYAP